MKIIEINTNELKKSFFEEPHKTLDNTLIAMINSLQRIIDMYENKSEKSSNHSMNTLNQFSFEDNNSNNLKIITFRKSIISNTTIETYCFKKIIEDLNFVDDSISSGNDSKINQLNFSQNLDEIIVINNNNLHEIIKDEIEIEKVNNKRQKYFSFKNL